MPSREDRVVRNEAEFRQVNESIARLTPTSVTVMHVVCECASEDCMHLLEVTPEQYEAVRAHPLRFIVTKGHELPEFERVVAEEDDYLVVEKHPGEAAETARRLHPRS